MAKKNILDYSTKQKDICLKNDNITENMYEKYSVNRGLRDINGKGILTGLTNISKITSMKNVDGVNVPVEGELWYRGYKVNSLIDEIKPGEFGFEKVAYLLLFGKKPTDKEYAEFTKIISENRTLPTNFTRDVIMKAPSKDIMNSMTRSILTLASYDENISSMALEDSIRQCLLLIAQAGDLDLSGQRENVRVIRESGINQRVAYEVNLCSAEELYNSPVYYLQQNDVIYVEPNKNIKIPREI